MMTSTRGWLIEVSSVLTALIVFHMLDVFPPLFEWLIIQDPEIP